MRLPNRLFKFIALILLTIVIIGLNLILFSSSLDLYLYLKPYPNPLYPDSYLFQIVKHLLKVLGVTIVEVAFVWLLVILNTMLRQAGLIVTLLVLILSGIIILVPINI